MDLHGKKILFIGIGFYDYENLILEKLKQSGAIVSYINTCHLTTLSRALNWLKIKAQANAVKQKCRTADIYQSSDNNDIVFVIKGQDLSETDIENIKLKNPTAKYILYLWDSLIRHDNMELLFNNFETVYSFDRQDCIANHRLIFRPLFYRQVPQKTEKRYVISFIGWMHSDRLDIVRKIKSELQNQNQPYFLKLYVSPMQYFLQRYIRKRLKPQDGDLIITKPLAYNDVQQIMGQSEMVLDIAHPLQSGLTMRTIEALAAGCHILTSNKDLVSYAQINPGQYTVFERNQIIIPTIDTTRISQSLDTYFSIDNFLEEILEQK